MYWRWRLAERAASVSGDGDGDGEGELGGEYPTNGSLYNELSLTEAGVAGRDSAKTTESLSLNGDGRRDGEYNTPRAAAGDGDSDGDGDDSVGGVGAMLGEIINTKNRVYLIEI